MKPFFFDVYDLNYLFTIGAIHLEKKVWLLQQFKLLLCFRHNQPCQGIKMKAWDKTNLSWNIAIDDNHNQNDNIIIRWDYEGENVMYFQARIKGSIMWISFDYKRTCCIRKSHWLCMSTMNKLWRGNECSKPRITKVQMLNIYHVHLKEYML
jgi:hypothetical protein